MPPMLPEAISYSGAGRFFGLWYNGHKATWTDGRSMATFPYFAIYAPLVDHPLMRACMPNTSWELGTDDSLASKILLCDREEGTMAVADYAEGHRFLSDQHPPLRPPTTEEAAVLEQKIEKMMSDPFTLTDARRLGLFETIGGAPRREQELGQTIVQFLDQCLKEIRKMAEQEQPPGRHSTQSEGFPGHTTNLEERESW